MQCSEARHASTCLQVRWHEAALERHAAELDSLQTAARQLADHLGGSGSAADGGSAAAAGAAPPSPLEGAWGGSCEVHPPVTGRAVMILQLQRGTASEVEEVEARASDETEWGAVLQVGLELSCKAACVPSS